MIDIGITLIALLLAALAGAYALDLRAKLDEMNELLAEAQHRCAQIQDQLDDAEQQRENAEQQREDAEAELRDYKQDISFVLGFGGDDT